MSELIRGFVDLRKDFYEGIPPVDWLAKPWLVAGEIHNVIGHGGVGKSTLLHDMAVGLATGTDFLGGSAKVVRPVKTIFFDRDSGPGQTRRSMKALTRGRWGDTPPDCLYENLYLYPLHDVALEGAQLPRLATIIDALEPGAIFFDALCAYHTKEENSSKDMAYIYREVLRGIADEGVAVIMLHHESKPSEWRVDARSASRGSTEITAAADVNMRVTRKNEKESPVLNLEKARNLDDDEWPGPVTYRLYKRDGVMRISI